MFLHGEPERRIVNSVIAVDQRIAQSHDLVGRANLLGNLWCVPPQAIDCFANDFDVVRDQLPGSPV